MPVVTELAFTADPAAIDPLGDVVVIGRKEALRSPPLMAWLRLPEPSWQAMLDRVEAGDSGASTVTWVDKRRIVVGVLPEPCSRHNPPARTWAIPELARKLDGRADGAVVLALSDPSHAFAACLAVARAFPLFGMASGAPERRRVAVLAWGAQGPVSDPRIGPAMAAVREAARLSDMPTNLLHTDAFVAEARAVAAAVGAQIEVISGADLDAQGFGGLWGVGKAAAHPPALVALTHAPKDATRTVAWVGKGIVYDTGGLSLKDRTSMVGMKGDMAGAAAVLSAFKAAVTLGFPHRLVAVLCLAENSVGPDSTRPDDVLVMKSGRTVEVNNTDAEGRLVLGDGVSWTCATHKPDLLVDLATLTGAALMATGKFHAALYCNDEALERATVAAGLRAGEPAHALLYAPELHRKEFRSQVADMKNSVKDRMNAQSSCAGQFIANHLPDPAPAWVHVDMAGPAGDGEGRATGYGVGLLLELGSGVTEVG